MTLVIGIFVSVSAFAQDITVKGHVKDDLGEDVIGASVRLKSNSTVGCVTDLSGNFSLKVQRGATLVVSFIGYETQEVKAAPTLNITLREDAKLLNEAVIIGYGSVKKTDLTGSVSTLKPDEKNHGLVTNAQDMIQGKIAGVNVVPDGGTPGGGATIRIRGGSSLSAKCDPLYVIDGVILDDQGVKGLANPLSMINPADIESFTVLKDASSCAIYGSRGSNGVIIITTKKGSKGKAPQINYNGNVSVSMKRNSLDLLTGDEMRDFVKNYYGVDSKAYKLLGDANTDWNKEIYRAAVSTDHNLSVSGGTKHLPYRVSLGYTDQNGILKTSNFQRYSGSFNLSPTLLDDHLRFNINGKFMYAKNRYADTDAISAANRMDPTQSVYDENAKNFGGYTTWTSDASAFNDNTWTTTQNSNTTKNPVALLQYKNDRADSYDYMISGDVDYSIHGFEDLTLHVGVTYDRSHGHQRTVYDPYGQTNNYFGNNGYADETKYSYAFTAYATYSKDFNDNHSLSVMGGYEYSLKRYWGESFYQSLYPSTNPQAGKLYSGNEKPALYKQHCKLGSYMGRLNYTLMNRYLLTATLRYDGSSRFADDRRWGVFPSTSLAWKINEEPFLRDVEAIDELKLRAGWGKTGQQDGIGNYSYFATYNENINSADGLYPITGINDSGIIARPDDVSKLRWEVGETYNVGIDASFFGNRLIFNADYYYRPTSDLICYAAKSVLTGFKNQGNQNIGKLLNQGVEVSVIGRPIATKDWQLEIAANVGYNKNEIKKLTGDGSKIYQGGISSGTGNNCRAYTEGQDAYAFYVYQQVYDEAGKPLEGVYVDRNADGQITEDDRYYYKTAIAPINYGLSARLQYKSWDLGISFRGTVGNYVFNDTEASYANVSKTYDSSFEYVHNILHSTIEKNHNTYDAVLSDYYVQNASFLKCDNITLGYSFQNLFKNASYKGITGRVYGTVTNVFTITKYKGLDPEVFGGIDNNLYPRPITCTLGLSLNF